ALGRAPRLALASVRLAAPVPQPPKFFGVGFNYAAHIAETGMSTPKFPPIFTKQRTCATGPYDPIHRPRVSPMLDYEGELGFVIGRRCRHVPVERAREVIAGYVVVNDVSVRDWQFHSPTMTLGKSFDTHGPFGPWLVTPDEIGDPHALDLRTLVNGEVRQSANTSDLVFNCFDVVAYLSTVCTLEPGDVITTGSPAGVGAMMSPPCYLAAGDVVRVEIAGLGHIENRVIEEPAETAQI
ncbi:MAG: fumarylacetoacetate hydrolase family protein, partial [Candidatus Binatia bacterium]